VDSTDPTALAEALAVIDTWPVPSGGVVVVDARGVIAHHGRIDELLPIASLSKPLTAAAVLVASDQGLVDLDEPAGPTAADGATVRHLLAHAGGLGYERGERTMAPERRRIYSNWSFDALGDLLAERTGTPVSAAIRRLLTEPLGMTATELDGSPAWAMRSTVTDLGRFVRELIAPALLSPSSHAALTHVAFEDLDGVLPGFGRQRPNSWTLGLEVRGTKEPHWAGTRLSQESVGHFGRSGSLLWMDPAHRIGLATLSGRDFDDWAREAWPALNDAVIDAIST